jgi:hypothetical protein
MINSIANDFLNLMMFHPRENVWCCTSATKIHPHPLPSNLPNARRRTPNTPNPTKAPCNPSSAPSSDSSGIIHSLQNSSRINATPQRHYFPRDANAVPGDYCVVYIVLILFFFHQATPIRLCQRTSSMV